MALALAPRCARAQTPRTETLALEVTRDASSVTCPDLERVRASLRARLGRDVVEPGASRHATLRFVRRGRGHAATLRVTAPGRRRTLRALRSSERDCTGLGEAASLVLAILIDPASALRASPPEPPPPPPRPPAEPPPPPPSTPPGVIPVTPRVIPTPPRAFTPSRWSWSWAILGVASFVGTAPGTFSDHLRLGGALRGSVRRGSFSTAVDLGIDAPGVVEDASRGARAWAVPVQLVFAGCWNHGSRVRLALCGTGSVAAVIARAEGYSSNRSDVAWAAGLGARASAAVMLSARWGLVVTGDVRGLFVRPSIEVIGRPGGPLWVSPPVSASFALGVEWNQIP